MTMHFLSMALKIWELVKIVRLSKTSKNYGCVYLEGSKTVRGMFESLLIFSRKGQTNILLAGLKSVMFNRLLGKRGGGKFIWILRSV